MSRGVRSAASWKRWAPQPSVSKHLQVRGRSAARACSVTAVKCSITNARTSDRYMNGRGFGRHWRNRRHGQERAGGNRRDDEDRGSHAAITQPSRVSLNVTGNFGFAHLWPTFAALLEMGSINQAEGAMPVTSGCSGQWFTISARGATCGVMQQSSDQLRKSPDTDDVFAVARTCLRLKESMAGPAYAPSHDTRSVSDGYRDSVRAGQKLFRIHDRFEQA